jgi:8-oxo-dGTP pyrophosphatase MutT (NUDIX family)
MDILREIICQEGVNPAGRAIYREAVRGIILDGSRLLMVYSTRNGDYKFPGGGVGAGETHHQALAREILEECGARVARVDGEFGLVIEYDFPIETEYDVFKMGSYYYLCQVEDSLCELQLDPYELDLGFQAAWVDIDTAIATNTEVLLRGADYPRWTRRDTYVLGEVRRKITDHTNN